MKTKRGISLIVLVITIIVMIILATAIILSLNSSGIIGKANEAKTKSDIANAKNVVALARAEWELDKELQETPFKDYAEGKLEEAGYITNKVTGSLEVAEDGTLYTYPIIPAGFIASTAPGEDTVAGGLVIYEGEQEITNYDTARTSRDQYVWIPVLDIGNFERRDGYSEGVPQTIVKNKESTEPYTLGSISAENDVTGEFAEYASMRKSVEKYGGFYIARYEAGTTNQRSSSKATGTSVDANNKPDIMSQKNKYLYNAVGWGPSAEKVDGEFNSDIGGNYGLGAVALARSVYPKDEEHDVVSTLVYGVQWDAIMYFLKDVDNPNVPGKKYIEDSTGMGVYNLTAANRTGNYEVKNIYDLAGNVAEWTMEGRSKYNRYARSGHWVTTGYKNPASYRNSMLVDRVLGSYGFRVALYLK